MLGRPGAGCSTLLKTLANRRAEYHSVHGEVCYDSLTSDDIGKRYRGDIIYVPEDDVHFNMLTVHQTLRFAAGMRAPYTRANNQTREEYVELAAEVVETALGLRHVKDTAVGDASLRGVSGGEKKRVSIGEALLSRAAITAWDKCAPAAVFPRLLSFVLILVLTARPTA